jgi:hypothetical protein
MSGPVVNGGLIDFQDNLQRGVQEYVTPSMILQAATNNNMQGAGMPANMAPQFSNVAGNTMIPNAGFMQQNGVFQGAANPAGGILCGPASFLHVNGVTYKPVEEPNARVSAHESTKTVSASHPVESEEQGPRVLSKRELQQAIDDRVRTQVNAYVRNQSGLSPDEGRVSSSSLYSPEEMAAKRVADLNATMPRGRNGGNKKKIQSQW